MKMCVEPRFFVMLYVTQWREECSFRGPRDELSLKRGECSGFLEKN